MEAAPPDFPESSLSRNLEIGLWFEKSWTPGRSVSIEECLALVEPSYRQELFERLLEIDLSLGIQHRALKSTDDYLRRFPDYGDMIERIVEKKLQRSFVQNSLRIGNSVGGGKYIIKEQLGKGGMGVVYRALDKKLERMVAIKYISHKLQHDQEGQRRFLDEIKLLGRIPRHENVVQAYSCDQDGDGLLFLVMEFIEGVDLAQHTIDVRIRDHSCGVSPIETCQIGLQIARGLRHLHENGIVHLDMKPANVILDVKGVVRICDLGLGTLVKIESESFVETSRLNSSEPDDSKTVILPKRPRLVCHGGTPGYWAPEIQYRNGQFDERADIYGLGATLLFLLTGNSPLVFSSRYPESEPKDDATRAKRLRVYFQSLRISVPAELTETIARMMAYDLSVRYMSMDEVVAALESVLKIITAKKRTFPTGWVLLGAGACLLVALAAFVFRSPPNLKEPLAPPQSPKQYFHVEISSTGVPESSNGVSPAEPLESAAVPESFPVEPVKPPAEPAVSESGVSDGAHSAAERTVSNEISADEARFTAQVEALEAENDWPSVERVVTERLVQAAALSDKERFFLLQARAAARARQSNDPGALEDTSEAIALRERHSESDEDFLDYRPYLLRAGIHYRRGQIENDQAMYDLAEKDLQSVSDIDFQLSDDERLSAHPNDYADYLSLSAILELLVFRRYGLKYSWDYLQELLDLKNAQTDFTWIERLDPSDNAPDADAFWENIARIETDNADFNAALASLAGRYKKGKIARRAWEAALRGRPERPAAEKILTQIRNESAPSPSAGNAEGPNVENAAETQKILQRYEEYLNAK